VVFDAGTLGWPRVLEDWVPSTEAEEGGTTSEHPPKSNLIRQMTQNILNRMVGIG